MPKLELPHHILKWMQRIVSTHKFTGAFLLLALCLTFVIPVLSESVLSSTTIGTGGLVNSSGAMLLFSTDFSGMTKGTYLGYPALTMSGQSAGTLALNLLGGSPLKNYFIADSPSTDDFWIDDTTSSSRQYSNIAPSSGHNGQRYVIGMKAISGRRNEFNLVHAENWLPATNSYYVSLWVYFPTTWTMNTDEYYALGDVWQEESEGLLKSEFHIHQYSAGHYDMALEYGYPGGSGINSKWVINTVDNVRPPLGQWFNFKFYVDAVSGREMLWIDDLLICDTDVNAPTVDFPPLPAQYLITIAKIYTSSLPSGGFQMWVSDLQIYDRIP